MMNDSNNAVVVESSLLSEGKTVTYMGYAWAKAARHYLGIDDRNVYKLLEILIAREENMLAGKQNEDNNYVSILPVLNAVDLTPVVFE
jgi:hypothetical protein